MQLLIFFVRNNSCGFGRILSPYLTSYEVWWAQMDFMLIGCSATKWHSPFLHTRPFRDFGGLKWTRTIDLTLIRRVL